MCSGHGGDPNDYSKFFLHFQAKVLREFPIQVCVFIVREELYLEYRAWMDGRGFAFFVLLVEY